MLLVLYSTFLSLSYTQLFVPPTPISVTDIINQNNNYIRKIITINDLLEFGLIVKGSKDNMLLWSLRRRVILIWIQTLVLLKQK